MALGVQGCVRNGCTAQSPKQAHPAWPSPLYQPVATSSHSVALTKRSPYTSCIREVRHAHTSSPRSSKGLLQAPSECRGGQAQGGAGLQRKTVVLGNQKTESAHAMVRKGAHKPPLLGDGNGQCMALEAFGGQWEIKWQRQVQVSL